MASIFWDNQGVIMVDYLEQGRNFKGCILCRQIEVAMTRNHKKSRGKLTCGVLLLQDNAPAHTSQGVMTAATECGFEILPHSPYFPAMAPSDFCSQNGNPIFVVHSMEAMRAS